MCGKMAVLYRVENQAGERVGVENHPGSDYSGRQYRPLKGVVRECGLDLGISGLYEENYGSYPRYAVR